VLEGKIRNSQSENAFKGLKAELSVADDEGSVRLDIFEDLGDGRGCVHDYKIGKFAKLLTCLEQNKNIDPNAGRYMSLIRLKGTKMLAPISHEDCGLSLHRSFRTWSRIAVVNVLLMLAVLAAQPASALDCSDPKGGIERLICRDEQFRKIEQLYTTVLERVAGLLDRKQREEFIKAHERWLQERAARCEDKADRDLAICVGIMLVERGFDLRRRFEDPDSPDSVWLNAGRTIKLGNTALAVLDRRGDDEPLRLVHADTLIAESMSPFELNGRGGDDRAEAVVITARDDGTFRCVEQYLLSARSNEPLRVVPLNPDPYLCWRTYVVRPKGADLELTLDALPGRDGEVRIWTPDASASFVVRRLEFAPHAATTMGNFDKDSRPTDNAEFYDALKRWAPRDWRSMALSLMHAVTRDDDAGGKYRVLTPCTGEAARCPLESTFAAYELATRSFFFAYEPSPASEAGAAPGEFVYYPGLEKWPADLAEIVRRWTLGGLRGE
jgi:uncharacterized protein YecT (DUF1311 family)